MKMIEKPLEHLSFMYTLMEKKSFISLYLSELSLGTQFYEKDFYKEDWKTLCVLNKVSDSYRNTSILKITDYI